MAALELMRTADLDFHLPPELIAQEPAADRAASRLLHYTRSDKRIAHRVFSDLPALLHPGDLLVFNDARVLPARFMLRKETGGLIESLFLDQPSIGKWHVLLRNVGSYRGPLFFVDADLRATIGEVRTGGEYFA
jgi:S-adenosylmethionine:tRNA ribosyltransferase-isomerase